MSSTAVKYVFVLPVWGEQYLDRFLRYGLPTQLAPGNLPRMPTDSHYRLFTLSHDAKTLRRSPAFRRLRGLMRTTVELIDNFDLSDSLAAMCECHMRALAEAAESDAAVVILHPDTLWSDGTFARLDQIVRRGKRAVMIACPRLNAETALPELRERFPGSDGISISANARELVELGLRHLHPVAEAHLWNDYRNTYPAHYYWRVGNQGLLIRSFDLTHIILRPVPRTLAVPVRSQHFVRLMFPKREDVHVVSDSDEICGFEFSISDHWCDTVARQPVPLDLRRNFVYRWTNDYHCEFAQEKIRLHAGPVDATWQEAERESDRAVAELLDSVTQHYGEDGFAKRPMVHPPLPAVVKPPERSRKIGLARRLVRRLAALPVLPRRVGPLSPSLMTGDQGYGYWIDLRPFGVSAPSDRESVSRVILLENGAPLKHRRRLHAAINRHGMGRHSHWGDSLIFSTSDNSDPRTNGRAYVLRVPQTLGELLSRLVSKLRRTAAQLRSSLSLAR